MTLIIQNSQALLFTGTPTVTGLTAVSSLAETHPSATQFFLCPSPATEGDIVVACGRYQSGGASLPSVFTPLLVSAADGNLWAGYRILGAGEAGTLQNMPAGAVNWVNHQVAYRPNVPITDVNPTVWALSGPTPGTPPNVVIPSCASPSIAWAFFQSTGALSAGMTPTHDAQINAGIANVAMSVRKEEGSPTSITCSSVDAGDFNLIFGGALSIF